MSNAIFPVLRGIAAERDATPEFDNVVTRAASGRRYAMGKRFFPVWRWSLKVNFLRQRMGHTELTDLQGFFLQRRGNLDSFLYRDREWNSVETPQVFGQGNGVDREFQLVYNRGGFIDRVGHVPATGLVVRVNGVATTAFTRSDFGGITFNTAPAAGAVLDWAGDYYFRVAFSKDSMTFKQFLKDLYSTGVDIETVNVHTAV